MTFFMNCNKHVILNVLLASSRVPKGRWIQLQLSSRLNWMFRGYASQHDEMQNSRIHWILRGYAPLNDGGRSKVIQ